MPLKLGLLGSGISHSRMPLLQKHLGEISGLDIDYQLLDEPDHQLDPVKKIRQIQQQGFQGINVTHPFKQKIVEVVARSYIAGHEAIGSYNTLRFIEGDIVGANTDYSGFIRAYQYVRGEEQPGKVFIAGAGGVGRAVACALVELGCERLIIYDPVLAQAETLANSLSLKNIDILVAEPDEKAELIRASDGLVNCSNLGMHKYPGSAFNAELIDSQRWAFDAVYTPLETEFISACRESDLQCISGFYLWLFQGLEAFKIFTGKEINFNQDLVDVASGWFDLKVAEANI